MNKHGQLCKNELKAIGRSVACIEAGKTITVSEFHSPVWTFGPYHEATGRSGFAAFCDHARPYDVIKGIHDQPRLFFGLNASFDCAEFVLLRVGSTRLREAAILSDKKDSK
jgi:hypothetical protein